MKVELSTIGKGIAKLKQFQSDINALNKKTYHSVLASLESVEPDFVQDEMPLGEITTKVDKLNRMLNERVANTVLSTLDYVNPLIESYLKEVPEQFNPEAFQTAKDNISQPFTSNPIPPFHALSEMQRENVLNVVKKHFDLADTPSIDLVNTLIEGYNAGAPKLNIARQANINFVVKQEFDITEDNQRILDLELVAFLKHRIRELFITMDKLKFDKSMGTDSLSRVINEFLSSGDCDKLGRLKEIVATSSIINSESLESHETNLDKIHVENIPVEVMTCAKDIYSPGLKDIITRLANSAKGDMLSELIEEHNHSIYLNNLFSLYVVFLDEVNILTASIGLLAKVLKVNADVLGTATTTINELDAKLDELFRELVEVTGTEDTVSTEMFGWIKKLFSSNYRALKIKKLPDTVSELIALEVETRANIEYLTQSNISNFEKNKDRFLKTIKPVLDEFFIKPQFKDFTAEQIEDWVKEGMYSVRPKSSYPESFLKFNKESLLKLAPVLNDLDEEVVRSANEVSHLTNELIEDLAEFQDREYISPNEIRSYINRVLNPIIHKEIGLEGVFDKLNIFKLPSPVSPYKLEELFKREFKEAGKIIYPTYGEVRELIKNNINFVEPLRAISKLYHIRDSKSNDYDEEDYYGLTEIMEETLDVLSESLYRRELRELETALDAAVDKLDIGLQLEQLEHILNPVYNNMNLTWRGLVSSYETMVFIQLAYLEALKGQ